MNPKNVDPKECGLQRMLIAENVDRAGCGSRSGSQRMLILKNVDCKEC